MRKQKGDESDGLYVYNYDELLQFWHEYYIFGPPMDAQGDAATLEHWAEDFASWLDVDDNPYGLRAVMEFFAEREKREGTAFPWPNEELRTG